MTALALFEEIKRKQSFLCVGLDTELSKLPPHLLGENFPLFVFNRHMNAWVRRDGNNLK